MIKLLYRVKFTTFSVTTVKKPGMNEFMFKTISTAQFLILFITCLVFIFLLSIFSIVMNW